jgi:hypothetical protein
MRRTEILEGVVICVKFRKRVMVADVVGHAAALSTGVAHAALRSVSFLLVPAQVLHVEIAGASSQSSIRLHGERSRRGYVPDHLASWAARSARASARSRRS